MRPLTFLRMDVNTTAKYPITFYVVSGRDGEGQEEPKRVKHKGTITVTKDCIVLYTKQIRDRKVFSILDCDVELTSVCCRPSITLYCKVYYALVYSLVGKASSNRLQEEAQCPWVLECLLPESGKNTPREAGICWRIGKTSVC